MIRALGWFTVYGFVLLVIMALWDYGVAGWRRFVAHQMGVVLEEERARHGAELQEARRQHKDAQLWLMETHRQDLARHEAQLQQRVTEAVVEAMTSRAPHPLGDAA